MRCRFVGSIRCVLWSWVIVAFASNGSAGDWPMWRYDAGHTAASPHDLPEVLHLQWIRQYTPRDPVWDDPLNRDLMPYDRVFEPVVAGGRMFVGFNDADKVVALDVRDGSEIWSFYADGPVRFSPVVHKDSVLFTSDDGHLYCVGAVDGQLRWRFRGGPSERKLIGNRRVISSWPARGGPVVADGVVYFSASIWPFMGTFIYALDAETGKVLWLNDDTHADFQKQPHSAPTFAGIAPQGQLAVAGGLLLVPGGRSLPAGFDRRSGELKFFAFGGKGEGGSFVAAEPSRAFVHTRVRGTMALALPGGSDTDFRANEPVLAGEVLYTADGAQEKSDGDAAARIEAYDQRNRKLWEVEADGTGDLIKAGRRLYAAGGGTLTAIDLPQGDTSAKIAWRLPVAEGIVRLVAAADRLFAVTLDGRILAFGQERIEPRTVRQQSRPLRPSDQAVAAAERLLAVAGERAGYALWYGVDDGSLLEAVAAASEYQVVAVDSDADKVTRLRRRLDEAGLYGHRVAVHVGQPETFRAPPYIANLVVIGRGMAPELSDPNRLRRVYESVRPYGGRLWIDCEGQVRESIAQQLTAAYPSRDRGRPSVIRPAG